MDFSQLKNEGKLSINYEDFEGYLVDLFNKTADRAKSQYFGELTVYRHGTVGIEIFERAGVKVVSLLKRDLYPLSPTLIHRKVNSVVTHEAEEVDRLEQYLLTVWATVQEKAPLLFKELQVKNLGPISFHETSAGRSGLNKTVETRNLLPHEQKKAARPNSLPKQQQGKKSAAELTFGAPVTLSKQKEGPKPLQVTVSSAIKPAAKAVRPNTSSTGAQTPTSTKSGKPVQVHQAPSARTQTAQKLLQPTSRAPVAKPAASPSSGEQKKPKGIMKSPSLKLNKSLSEAVAA